jgi:hypothetical protein
VDVLIVLGDQDTFHENDDEIDASPIWLSDILRDEGIVAQFVIHARRAEILAEFGREDTIAAMRRHEIGLHGRDVHPVLPELVEGLGWAAGVEAMRAAEGEELGLLGRVFDAKPTCSSQHRHQAAPQAFGFARELGIPYLFGYPGAAPEYSISWYAGALSLPLNGPGPGSLCFFPAVFDDALPDDALFAQLFARLEAHVARGLEVGLPVLVVFVCHPERLCYYGALEQWQYANGANRGIVTVPKGVEKRRSNAEITRSLDNFRTLIRYLRDHPELELTTTAEMSRRYGRQATRLARVDLAQVAGDAVERRVIPVGGRLSAADALLGFAVSIANQVDDSAHLQDVQQIGRNGGALGLPEVVERIDVLGPLEVPPLAPGMPTVNGADVAELARALVRYARETGYLPHALPLRGRELGLGSIYGALATTYHATASTGNAGADGAIELGVWPRYPELGLGMGACHRLCTEDPLVRPGLSTDAAAMHAQLQTWTLKAAVRDGAAA